MRSNENVATFIKELVLELPDGEDVGFKAGGYIQIEAKNEVELIVIDEKTNYDACPFCDEDAVESLRLDDVTGWMMLIQAVIDN